MLRLTLAFHPCIIVSKLSGYTGQTSMNIQDGSSHFATCFMTGRRCRLSYDVGVGGICVPAQFRDRRLAAITQQWLIVAVQHILIVNPETVVGAKSWSTWIRCGPSWDYSKNWLCAVAEAGNFLFSKKWKGADRVRLFACFSSFFLKGLPWSVLLAWCSQYWCGGW